MTSPLLQKVREIQETGRPTIEPEEYLKLRGLGHSDEDIRAAADVLEPPPEHPYAKLWNRVVRPGLQGASAGFSDELRGAAEAAGAVLPGGRSPGEAYIEGRNAERGALADAKAKAPILSRVSEFAGGVLTPGGAFLKAGKGAGVLGKAAVGAATGGVFGGLAGAGMSEGDDPNGMASLNDVVGDAASGAVVGSIGGGLIGGGIGAAQNVGRAVTKNVRRAQAIGRMVDDAAEQAAAEAERRANAPKTIREAIERAREAAGKPIGGMGPKAPMQRLREWPVPPPTPPSPLLNALAEAGQDPRFANAAMPKDLGQKGFASTLTGRGWAADAIPQPPPTPEDDVATALAESLARLKAGKAAGSLHPKGGALTAALAAEAVKRKREGRR